ncbi:hypothetical protein DKM19_18485 [Streptosporangium sp. 'caverna']|nr:hypothetical protein DKM19_18485 [Streptosporangium sp. 'caverna']
MARRAAFHLLLMLEATGKNHPSTRLPQSKLITYFPSTKKEREHVRRGRRPELTARRADHRRGPLRYGGAVPQRIVTAPLGRRDDRA